ncbi:MAG: Gfo/Idh/MocA family oxidoreductase [Oligoflexia bacterium]|nr:Gfo/Idh/MocA family oxidoreductase [Oligoflexia bacterium]
MKLNVGMAGFGVVGKRRRHYIDQHPHLKVVAVCDQTFERSGEIRDGVKCFRHYHELLAERLDVLFVCLPNYLAAEVTATALDRGLHTFCEKPPGRDLQDVAQVLQAEKRNPRLKLMYGFNHRYHESVQDALKLIAAGDLGQVVNLRGLYGKSKLISFGQNSDWRVSREYAGGGILLDQGIHMLDLMRLFAGDFTEIQSFVSNSYWQHDVEDNAYALMRSSSGVVAMLHSTATQWRHRFELDICCERGSLTLSGILSSSKSYGQETLTVAWADRDGVGDPREQRTLYNQDPSWRLEIEDFANCVLNNTAVSHGTAADAFKTMELVYKIYCADKEWSNRWGLSSAVVTPASKKAVA